MRPSRATPPVCPPAPETVVAATVRRLIEIERDGWRRDIDHDDEARDAAVSKIFRLLKRDLVQTESETVHDIALKLSVLCNHLRTLLDTDNSGGAWAYRLSEAIRSDAERMAIQMDAEVAGRDPLKG